MLVPSWAVLLASNKWGSYLRDLARYLVLLAVAVCALHAVPALACTDAAAVGLVADGVTDNVSAMNQFLHGLPNGVGCLEFDPGTYYFSSGIVATVGAGGAAPGAFSLRGAGADVTILKFAAGHNGLTLEPACNSNSVNVRDLTVASMQGGGYYGVAVVTLSTCGTPITAPSAFHNVTIRGIDCYACTDYWTYGIAVDGARWINFDGVTVYSYACDNAIGGQGCWTDNTSQPSYGVYIFGTSTLVPVQFNFWGCHFDDVVWGIWYGAYAQGIIVTNTDFVGDGYGVDADGVGADQLTVIGNNFNVSRYGIIESLDVPGTQIANNYFLIPTGGVGIQEGGTIAAPFTLTGNFFQGLGGAQNGVGIAVNADTGGGTITGNGFAQLATGVFLTSSTTLVGVNLNTYSGNAVNVSNSGNNNPVGQITP